MENTNVVVEQQRRNQQQHQSQNQSATTQSAQKSSKKKAKNKNRNSNGKSQVDDHAASAVALDTMNGGAKRAMLSATNGNCVAEDGHDEIAVRAHDGADSMVNGLSEQLKHAIKVDDDDCAIKKQNKSNGVAHRNGDASQHSNGVAVADGKTAYANHQSTDSCHSTSNHDSRSSVGSSKKSKRKNEQIKKAEQKTETPSHCQRPTNAAHNNGSYSVLDSPAPASANNQSTENHPQVQSLTKHPKHKGSNDKAKLENGFNNNNNNDNVSDNPSGSSRSKRSSTKTEPIDHENDNTSATTSSASSNLTKGGVGPVPSAVVSVTQSLASATISDSDTATASEASPSTSSTSSSPSSITSQAIETSTECVASTSAAARKSLEATATGASSASSASQSADQAVANLSSEPKLDLSNVHIEYKEYESELQMHDIMRLIQAELSEPYSIYTYRYFIYNWPKLCFLAAHGDEYVGAIVCKLDMHMNVRRGYIAMLAVRKEYRKLRIGTTLVQKAIEAMLADKADEVVLETEMRNEPALRLYENLGFVRDKRLFRYYLNGVDALRLKLWFR